MLGDLKTGQQRSWVGEKVTWNIPIETVGVNMACLDSNMAHSLDYDPLRMVWVQKWSPGVCHTF